MLSVSHSSSISSVSLVYSGIVVNVFSFFLCFSIGGIIDFSFSCRQPPMLTLNAIAFFALLKCSCLITKASVLVLHISIPLFINLL